MTQSTNQKMSLESDSLHRYQQASGIGARVLAELVDRCRSGVSIGELCAYADARIQEEVRFVFFCIFFLIFVTNAYF